MGKQFNGVVFLDINSALPVILIALNTCQVVLYRHTVVPIANHN